MGCNSPLRGWRKRGGGLTFRKSEAWSELHITVPCWVCLGCRISRAREWAIRCVHEAQTSERNCFITLTYDQEHLPADLSVDVEEWKRFAKRLRKKHDVRYLHCGEYGGQNLRPHYHACLFGVDFAEDREVWQEKRGYRLYRSPTLEKLWPFGFSTIGELNYQTASYTARYVMKKAYGKTAPEAYTRRFGNREWRVKPDYVTMSRRPGLGADWFEKYWRDLYPSDFVVIEGKKAPVPKFYDKLMEEKDPEMMRAVRRRRAIVGTERSEEWTDVRLWTREQILRSHDRNAPRDVA